jgi:hypothetical protein
MLAFIDEDPKLVREEVDSIQGKLWKDAMVEEMESLHKNDMCVLVGLPNGIKPIYSKWVFKKKMKTIGQDEKFKYLLVAKGYSQFEGVDFGDIFSPISKI